MGSLATAHFALNAAADADDFFVFNTTTSTLSFDADGNGATAAVAMARLNGIATLAASDIQIFAA